MCYLPTVKVTHPQLLTGLRPGQWIDYDGAKGRYMGRTGSTVWIAWGGTARKRFHIFAAAFRKEMARRSFKSRGRELLTSVTNRAIANGAPIITAIE